MKDLLKRAAGGVHSGAELYRKLSRLERIAFGLLAVVVVISLALLLSSSGTDDYRVIATDEGRDGVVQLQRAIARLDEAGIPWKERSREDGGRAVAVPLDGQRRALAILEKENIVPASASTAALNEGGSLFETPGRLESRLQQVNLKKCEQSILWNKNLQAATITVNYSRKPLFARSRNQGDSAAVVVVLKRDVERLSRREADTIREIVRCGLGLRPEDISISDNRGVTYEPASAKDADLGLGSAQLSEKEEQWRQWIRDDIRQMYSMAFESREFYVGVIISLSHERSSIEKKEMDREKSFKLDTRTEIERGVETSSGGILSAADGPISLRESNTSIPFDSFQKTHTDIPPGELKGVSVVVNLDLDAVERVDAARREGSISSGVSGLGLSPSIDREARVKAYAAQQEEILRKYLNVFKNASVAVLVDRFVKPSADAAPVATTRIAGLEPAPLVPEAFQWIERAWRPATAVLAISCLALFLVKLLRGRQSIAHGGPWAARPAAGPRGGAPGVSFREPADIDWPVRNDDESGATVRERPEVAAAILRLWLAQEAEEPVEGGQRA